MNAFRLVAFAGICFMSAVLAASPASQENTADKELPSLSGPSSIDEHLVYTIKWDPPWYLFFLPNMEAGEIDIELFKDSEYEGKKAFKILFRANSSGTLMKMTGMKISDDFVFYTEPDTYCTYYVTKKIHEGKRKRQIDVQYFRDTRQLHIHEVDESVDPPKVKKDETKDNIPACVHDPLSALYLYRLSNLRDGSMQTLVIGHDDRIKEVSARVEKQENVKIPEGEFPAWNISIISLMGGLFKEGGKFRIWLSTDEKKIPLKFEFKVRLGKIIGILQSPKP